MEGDRNAQPRERSTSASYGSIGTPGAEPGSVKFSGSRHFHISPSRSYIAVAILFLINLLDYIDRYIIAGILDDVQDYFKVSNSSAGLLQTVFMCSVMILTPLFGYLGDRYNRKILMCIGIFIWCVMTLAGSFTTQPYFWLLIVCRAFASFGDASFCTIAPTIIADLFVGTKRTLMISIFWIAIPVGSGLGYILGSGVMKLTGDWHWAMRVTPCMGLLVLLLLIFLVPNPPRGASEDHTDSPHSRTSWLQDLKYLSKIRSFVLLVFSTAAVMFITGALGFWLPLFLLRTQATDGSPLHTASNSQISSIIGLISCVTGIIGIGIGAVTSKYFKKKNPRADPLICAVGMLSSAPCMFLEIVLARHSIAMAYFFMFLHGTFITLNLAITTDILLYIVIPTRRSIAEAVLKCISHGLGDASSPYIIGAISDAIQNGRPKSNYWEFVSLEYAFLLCPFIAVVGGAFYLWTANYLEKDRMKASNQTESNKPPGAKRVKL